MIYENLQKMVCLKVIFLNWIDEIDFGNIINFLIFVILTLTFIWIIKYTRETQKMKEEMIHQRIMGDAFDIEFRLQSIASYDLENNQELHFADVEVSFSKTNNVCEFHLLDQKSNKIPRSNLFGKTINEDSFMNMNYWMGLGQRINFVDMLIKNKGMFKALVKTTSGNSFVYIYQTKTENYRQAKSLQKVHPKGGDLDAFLLVSKKPKFF